MTAFISARNRSRRVTLPFWVHAIPANVRCSPIPNLPPSSLDALLFYHVERLTQSFPSGVNPGEDSGDVRTGAGPRDQAVEMWTARTGLRSRRRALQSRRVTKT